MKRYIKKTHRGEIWMTDLGKNRGSEQNGLRPCLILNQAIKGEQTVFIVPASSKLRPQSKTIANYNWLIHQSRAVDSRRFIRLIERLSKQDTDTVSHHLSKFISKVEPPSIEMEGVGSASIKTG